MSSKDVFDFNIQFTHDIVFNEIRSIRSHIIYSLTSNISSVVDLILRQKIDYDSSNFKNAGNFYNTSQITQAINIFTPQEFGNICSAFTTSLKGSKFSSLASKISDPVKCFIYFTHYFYIPTRLDHTTIPELKLNSLANRWISCVCILLKIDSYTSKFLTTIPTLETFKMCLNQILDPKKKIEMSNKIKTFSYKDIESLLTSNFNEAHKFQTFICDLNSLMCNISVEIIRKFCPNYESVKNINPKYDGSWVSPFDEDVATQIKKIEDIEK